MFSATALATLAVCIAANSTTFGIVNSVLLRPLPASESDSTFTYAQSPWSSFTFAVKATAGTDGMATAVRTEMARIAPYLELFNIRTMNQRAVLSLSSRRTATTLAIGFGGRALLTGCLIMINSR